MNTHLILTAVAIFAVIILAFRRFSNGRYGTFSPNNEVSAAYQSYRVDPDCRYFISGPDDFPNAIMGIDKSLTLDNDLWKALVPTPEKIKDLVENMAQKASEKDQFLQGYNILDEQGHKIGNWFSLPGQAIMVKRSGKNSFTVTTPSVGPHLQR